MGSGNAWTRDELRDLRRLWPDHTSPEVAALIPRHSAPSCRNKARDLGLECSGARRLGLVPWTPDEDRAIRAAIPLMLAEEPRMRPVRLTRLANALDRDERHVAARMRHWLKETA